MWNLTCLFVGDVLGPVQRPRTKYTVRYGTESNDGAEEHYYEVTTELVLDGPDQFRPRNWSTSSHLGTGPVRTGSS
jgi:hypothetical protein